MLGTIRSLTSSSTLCQKSPFPSRRGFFSSPIQCIAFFIVGISLKKPFWRLSDPGVLSLKQLIMKKLKRLSHNHACRCVKALVCRSWWYPDIEWFLPVYPCSFMQKKTNCFPIVCEGVHFRIRSKHTTNIWRLELEKNDYHLYLRLNFLKLIRRTTKFKVQTTENLLSGTIPVQPKSSCHWYIGMLYRVEGKVLHLNHQLSIPRMGQLISNYH